MPGGTEMTSEYQQKKLVEKLEYALASLIHEGKIEWAASLAPLIEWLYKGEAVIAVLEGEAIGLDSRILDTIRQCFDVRW